MTGSLAVLWLTIRDNQAAVEGLVQLTRGMSEHLEAWDGPCECEACLSYSDSFDEVRQP